MKNISRNDVIWSYSAHFFSIASGIIILPMILRMFQTEEIAFYYIMLSISSLVALFDFGFSSQFGRNVSYVCSGAKELKKNGVHISTDDKEIDYKLLTKLIHTAKYVYNRIGLLILFSLLTIGSFYIYYLTEGFTSVNNSFLLWIVFSFSIYFSIYFSYYSALLVGSGLIMESKKTLVYSKVLYILLTFSFLLLGLGLLGVALASLISPFYSRWLANNYFFTPEITFKIRGYEISKFEIIELFKLIWHNAKKLGLVFVGTFAITRLSLFFAGIFLNSNDVASYGLMMQFVGLIASISTTQLMAYQPKFASLRVQNNKNDLLRLFSYCMNIFYILFILGSLVLFFLVPEILFLIKSNAILPSFPVLVIYLFITLLENNHSNYASLLVTKNEIPFVSSSLISGTFIITFSFLILKYTNLGILGLVLVQGFIQLVYNNWKWPYVISTEFNIAIKKIVIMGFEETFCRIKAIRL